MKLKDSPAVKSEVPHYNDLKDSADDVRNQRAVGEVRSGDMIEPFHSITQPEPDIEHGATPARVRKPSEVSEGHHVTSGGAEGSEPYKHEVIGLNKNLAKHAPDSDAHESPAPTPEAKSRAEYVKSQREAKDRTFESGRKPLKEMLKK